MSQEYSGTDVDQLMEGIRKELGHPPLQPVSAGASRLSVDEILRRVNREIANRRSSQESEEGAGGSAVDGGSPWQPATPRLPAKRAYSLGDLLAFSDRDFVDVAYRTVLRRPPDDKGFQHNLHLLRTGLASKVEILARLRWSQEGEARGVHIDGLLLPYLLQKWRRKRYVGPILSWLQAFVRLGRISDRQLHMDAAQARETQELGHLVNQLVKSFEQRLQTTEGSMERQERLYKERIVELEKLEDFHEQRLAQMSVHLDSIDAAIEMRRDQDQQALAQAKSLDALYAGFEDRFRGDMELVRTRIEPYIELIREVGAGSADAPVIDLGSGRGEWLELLRDHGLVGRGIDLNSIFLDSCRSRGLDVIENDALEGLRSLPDGSIGAITSMHLVEHLPFEQVVALIDEAFRVLRPGGLLLLETPNPENLRVGSHWFYMDPTHRNPLPPEMLRWLVEARGFAEARIERLTVARETGAPPLLADDVAGATSINVLLSSLAAPLDYAIVAKRP